MSTIQNIGTLVPSTYQVNLLEIWQSEQFLDTFVFEGPPAMIKMALKCCLEPKYQDIHCLKKRLLGTFYVIMIDLCTKLEVVK